MERLSDLFTEENLCPVCGRHRFSKRNSYEICPVCGWEDDALQKENPDFEGGANSQSLNEAREAYYFNEDI